jgi:hypothetical protein
MISQVKTYGQYLFELKAANLTGSWVLTKDYRYLTTVSNVIGNELELEFTAPTGQGGFINYPVSEVYLLTPAQVTEINNNVESFRFTYSLEDENQPMAEKEIRAAVKKHFTGGLDNLQEFDV